MLLADMVYPIDPHSLYKIIFWGSQLKNVDQKLYNQRLYQHLVVCRVVLH